MNLNNITLANDYLNESKLRIETAENALIKKACAYCIRQSQEAAELSLKAALRIIGVDFPKWHDVGEILLREKEKFPNEFQEHVPNMALISAALTKKREPAMYGDELSAMPPSKIFNEKDADDALKNAKFCYSHVEGLIKSLNENSKKEKIGKGK